MLLAVLSDSPDDNFFRFVRGASFEFDQVDIVREQQRSNRTITVCKYFTSHNRASSMVDDIAHPTADLVRGKVSVSSTTPHLTNPSKYHMLGNNQQLAASDSRRSFHRRAQLLK